ncbi:hypothetical protein LEP1GSC038_4079 [Leptospira weilii str. 2006001855]|uniref:Uncharacterized protein n=1 Tax=Leptospira weilii str. 2006001855 TaxID=996804 RepID=M6FYI5_9LEPT|nr:hypothetical protein LEP1GSC038_4079 [Leptospira weilii str. 2006001855]
MIHFQERFYEMFAAFEFFVSAYFVELLGKSGFKKNDSSFFS